MRNVISIFAILGVVALVIVAACGALGWEEMQFDELPEAVQKMYR